MFLWLTTLPWRQRNLRECRVGERNLRECRVGERRTHANIFKEVPGDNIATPPWVDELIAKDPDTKVWQFYFSSDETKNHHIVKGVLPERLVGPLEEYLERWRPILLGSLRWSTLFVDEAGDPLSKSSMVRRVRNVSYRELGQRVTPHSFRHSYALEWLDDHPRDHSALSRILWHANPMTTMRQYAYGFNESHGAVFVDEWFKELESKGTQNRQLAVIEPQVEGLSPIKKAALRRDHLLLLWLTTLPWKQCHLRECTVGEGVAGANIFKDVVAENVATPPWVKQLIANDPDARVWQFQFSLEETNHGRKIRGVLPERLVGPLEDYLEHWRPALLGLSRCDNLFVNKAGRPLTIDGVIDCVGSRSLLVSGRWTTPSMFRRSFAEEWLRNYPEDYLVLSKILWYSDPEMVFEVYGRDALDESDAAVRVDYWIKKRESERLKAIDRVAEIRDQDPFPSDSCNVARFRAS